MNWKMSRPERDLFSQRIYIGTNDNMRVVVVKVQGDSLEKVKPKENEEKLCVVHCKEVSGLFRLFSQPFWSDFLHCFICRLSDLTVSEDAGVEPRNCCDSVDLL
jgi:hypothetical protein